MPSIFFPASLSQAVDEYIGWIGAWNRAAFLDLSPRAEQALQLASPPSFDDWRKSALQILPQDQPFIDRLVGMHDKLHQLAKLVLMKTPDGAVVDRKDYESVVGKYDELMRGLRQLERAFAVAASGLDQLTGLRSRVGLNEDLAREHSRFLRSKKPFCVAIMDIDHFKAINDTYGHDAGDSVLAAVADHISRSMRSFDDAYRLGGEEFLLCLKEADLTAGMKILERLRSGLEKLPITLPNGHGINITASFGLTVSEGEVVVNDLVHRADQALYRAKNKGRNMIEVLISSAG